MKDAIEIEHCLILDALESYEGIFHDFMCCDELESKAFRQTYGIPPELGLHVLRGIISQYRLGPREKHPHTTILESLKTKIAGMVQQEIRAALPAPTAVATETVSVEDTRKRTITRARKVDALPPAAKPVRQLAAGPSCPKHPDATEFDKKGRCRQCQRDYQKEYAQRKKEKEGKTKRPYSRRSSIPGPKPRPHVPALDDLDDEDDADTEDSLGDAPEPMDDGDGDLDAAWERATPEPLPEPEPDLDIQLPPPLRAKEHPGVEFVYSKLVRCPKCGMESIRLRRRAAADMGKDYWIHVGPNCQVKIAHYKIADDRKYQTATL